MAANPRGSMRPNGRSPPFLAIGLCVALVILGFNYWSLSARNGEQANEISLMESELRLVNAKKTSSEKRSEALSDKVADLEKEMGSQKEIIANKMAELQTEKQLKEDCAQRINVDEEEIILLKEKLESCVAEKNSYISEVDQLKGDAEALKGHQCSESDCQTFVKLSREQTLQEISQVAGNSPLIALYNKGGDVGRFQSQLQDLAAQQNVPIKDGAPQQQNQDILQPQQPDAQVDSKQQPGQGEAVIPQQESPKEGSQNGDDNKESGVPQPGNEKYVDVKGDAVDVNAQVPVSDVDHQNETIHKGNSYTTPSSPLSSASALETDNGKLTKEMTETTKSNVVNNALTNSSNAGDGTNALIGDDDLDDDDNYKEDDDDDNDDILRVDDKENDDYDYEEEEDDDDDVVNARYDDNPSEKNDMDENDDAIDSMFKQQEMEQGK